MYNGITEGQLVYDQSFPYKQHVLPIEPSGTVFVVKSGQFTGAKTSFRFTYALSTVQSGTKHWIAKEQSPILIEMQSQQVITPFSVSQDLSGWTYLILLTNHSNKELSANAKFLLVHVWCKFDNKLAIYCK